MNAVTVLIGTALLTAYLSGEVQVRPNSNQEASAQITGYVSDCNDGKEYRMPRMDVYAYPMGSAPQIEESLARLREIVDQQIVDEQAGSMKAEAEYLEPYFAEYGVLLDLTETKLAALHVRTNRNGVYRLTGLPLNERYLILMIGRLEDEPSFYGYKETEKLTPGTHELNFPMGGPETCGEQGAK